MYTEIEARHPLLAINVPAIDSWDQWLQRWNDPAITYQERHGLLYCGLSLHLHDWPGWHQELREEAKITRLKFYLSLADGHSLPESYFRDHDNDAQAGQRRQLAQRAFAELAKHFFRPVVQREREALRYLLAPELTDHLLRFFRVEARGGSPRATNLRTSEAGSAAATQQRWARGAALELCRLAWDTQRADNSGVEQPAAHVQSRRSDFLPLYEQQPEFTELIKLGPDVLDEASWRTLGQLALAERPLPDVSRPTDKIRRAPHSIDEAAAYGSAAAQVCRQLNLRQREEWRLKALRQEQLERTQ